MTAPVAAEPMPPPQGFEPRILVFSTNNISDPGIDLMVMGMPCTSGIKPAWIAYAIEQGFDGVFVASDGDECAYLPDCAERASHIMAQAQELLRAAGNSPQRLKMAAICSVCAEPFTKHMQQFAAALVALGPSKAG
jgi:F420-non-reducing hydrogenase iron-sulfur subunit